MFFHLRPSPSSIASSDTSFSSDNSYIPAIARPPPAGLRQLVVHDLDEISLIGFNHQRPIQREPFRIPRPILTIPRPIIHVPTNSSLWTSNVRPTGIQQISRSPSPALITNHSERPLYQNVQLSSPPPPPLIPSIPTQFQIEPPPPFQQFVQIRIVHPIKPKKVLRAKPPGLFTTLSAGGISTLVVLIYISCLLALPIVKLVLGILYVKECPINKNIPLYMIVSGACGLSMIILLLLSSACTYCRSTSNAKKSTHGFMICIIALTRGMQGALAIFLFIWFLFGLFNF